MTLPDRYDALVVGAGPSGSAVAAHLARRGARVALLESKRHPRDKPCAEYASPRIIEELAALGLVPDAWADAALALDGMRIIRGDTAFDLRYERRGTPRSAWGLDRKLFDALLAGHAAASGAHLLQETALAELLRSEAGRDPGRVTGALVRRRNGRRRAIRADEVICADGARSLSSRLLGVERKVAFPRRLGLVAHYGGVAGLERSGEMHIGHRLYIGLAPTPGGEMNVGMALPLDRVPRPAVAAFEAAIASLPAVARRLTGSERLTAIRGSAPIGHRVARAAGPGWLLIGDAAGFIDPFTGEGIYRALRSARAAAEALLSTDPAAAYLAERRRAFAAKDALTWLIQGMLATSPLLAYATRRLASRPSAAWRLGSALGDLRPATDALAPRALMSVLRP